jgi:tape measure domain-containing protein
MNATGESAKEVKATLGELNTYSDKTIYSFSDMTSAIQKFVNAGVDLPTSVTTIKGIANAAAFAGASSEEASRAMYAFSQSMSLGFVGLQDWNQIENANMGTIRFKEELLAAGVAAGTLTKQGNGFITSSGKFVSATEGWRDGLQEQWATTEVLNAALGKYADTNTKLGKAAQESAQEVRTFTAFMDTLKESIESGWAAIFTQVFGNLTQATEFWTNLSNSIGGTVGAIFDFGETSLKTWRKMGGFEKTIEGIGNLLSPIGALFRVVGAAISAAFPSSGGGAGKFLYSLSSGFELVTRPLRVFAEVIEGAATPIATLIRLVRIVGAVIGASVGVVVDFAEKLLGLADLKVPSTDGFVGFIKDIAKAVVDAIAKIDRLIAKGASIGEAFGAVDISLPSMPSLPAGPDVSGAASAVSSSASSGFEKAAAGVKGLIQDVKNLGKASDDLKQTVLFSSAGGGDNFTQFGASLEQLKAASTSGGASVGGFLDFISGAWEKVKDVFTWLKDNFSFEDLIASFNLAVLTTFFFNMSKMFRTFSDVGQGLISASGGLVGAIGQIGQSLQGFADGASKQGTAKIILNLGIALGILAAAMYILSTVPGEKLAKSLLALAGGMGVIVLGFEALTRSMNKLDGKGINLKMIALSVSVGILAGALLLLAGAFLVMQFVDYESILKGLVTMLIVMKAMEGLGNMGQYAAKNMIAGAAAIAIIAGSMYLLAGALLLFKLISWEDMAKGGAALAGIALAVGLLALIPYEGIAKVGVALLLASLGVESMARAMLVFGLVDWSSILKGTIAMGVLVGAVALLQLMGGVAAASALLAIAGAMLILSVAMLALNRVDWESIGKMAVVMGVLIAGFAAFLFVVTAFAPALILMSAFAGSLALLAVAITGLALAFAVIFPLLAFGAGAFAAFATGAAVAFAVFVTTLAAEAPIIKKAFLDMLQVLIDGIVEAVPMIINGIKRLWTAVKNEFTDSSKSKETGKAGESWVSSAANGIKAKMPEIVKKGAELLITFLTSLRSKAADIAEAGVGLVISLIQGISRKIAGIVSAAVDLIIAFAKGIGDGLSRIVNAGIDLIGDFLHDLADAIRRSSGVIGSGLRDVVDAMKDVGMDMVQGLIDGVGEMFDSAMGKIGDLASGMVNKAKGILDIFSPSRVFRDIGKFLVMGLTKGIQENAASAIVAVASMVTGQIALSRDLIDAFVQELDQKALAARARAEGLRKAAAAATKAAKKTKSKEDDKAAGRLRKDAKEADKKADKEEKELRKEKAKQRREEEFEQATLIEKAQIRARQAENQIRAARQSEKDAEAARVQANALDRQSRADGLTPEQRKRFRKQADKLREQAEKDAKAANKALRNAKKRAEQALVFQQRAGAEAAANFQEQYEAEAKADADAAAFEKLTAAEKAAQRQKEAEELQKLADENLAKAKELAFTDITAANDLAALALEQAERARDLQDEAQDYRDQGGTGQVIDLTPTDAAAASIADAASLYDAAYAAAARDASITFNQYNSSPESLSTIDIYRQTNNLVTYAADQISSTAA